eukprot:CAMPEP_0194359574 /NCGR_PEP_ID=MMETSP0174-20130528/6829_1 /TAXON_ID=216777 /ORGANISM="Proboscia alata, Strain PI-D3" /LENGTH=387 /DNA_ID=CAMNT_0039130535 /DNA_START=44 /DNA_END=1207 /DNA_ORIENTATION=-
MPSSIPLLQESRRSISGITGIRLIVIILFCWISILLLLYRSLENYLTAGVVVIDHTYALSFEGAPPVIGNYALFSSVEVVYALTTEAAKLSGIALLFHGCSHNALKFFSPSPTNCRQCVGLSEELRISRILLEQGYAVLAITSQDRKSGCWSAKQDMPNVRTALVDFRKLIALQQLKSSVDVVLAFGASSGGRFAAEVAAVGLADAALVMVMSLGPSLTNRFIEMGKGKDKNKTARMPPIYLAPMPRDVRTTAAAKNEYATIMAASIQGDAPLVLDTTTCVPFAVTAEFLNERVPLMKKDAAELIVKSLINAGHLDTASRNLLEDPTKSNWRDVLKEECGDACLQNQVLKQGHSPLAKALHRAWAFHEYCSEVIIIAVGFFERELVK